MFPILRAAAYGAVIGGIGGLIAVLRFRRHVVLLEDMDDAANKLLHDLDEDPVFREHLIRKLGLNDNKPA
jgi:hypothetical protein